jgi:hypothetical protein
MIGLSQTLAGFFHPETTELMPPMRILNYSEEIREDLDVVLAQKRILFFASFEHEMCEHVFGSLKQTLSTLRTIDERLHTIGPDGIKSRIFLLTQFLSSYIFEYETKYVGFMKGPWNPNLSPEERDRNWPELGDAAKTLTLLHLLFQRVWENFDSLALRENVSFSVEQRTHDNSTHSVRNRRLCSTCGWDLNYYKRVRCPYAIPKCPSFDPSDTILSTYASDAVHVRVAGSFSGWQEVPLEQFEYGHWAVRLPLRPGFHQYKFIIDGVWLTDPVNPHIQRDDLGNTNSVRFVEGKQDGKYEFGAHQCEVTENDFVTVRFSHDPADRRSLYRLELLRRSPSNTLDTGTINASCGVSIWGASGGITEAILRYNSFTLAFDDVTVREMGGFRNVLIHFFLADNELTKIRDGLRMVFRGCSYYREDWETEARDQGHTENR